MIFLLIKLAVKYGQPREVRARGLLRGVHQDRNLSDFEKALKDYKAGEPSPHSVPRLPLLDLL